MGVQLYRQPRPRAELKPQRHKGFSLTPPRFRSGLEWRLAQQLDAARVTYAFEPFSLPYEAPDGPRSYLPDFVTEGGLIVEAKGFWPQESRRKMAAVKAAHPSLDLRMIFSDAGAAIGHGSPITYAMVADRLALPWAQGTIPPAWLARPPNAASLAALDRLRVTPFDRMRPLSSAA